MDGKVASELSSYRRGWPRLRSMRRRGRPRLYKYWFLRLRPAADLSSNDSEKARNAQSYSSFGVSKLCLRGWSGAAPFFEAKAVVSG
jgi:hypothetical protein